MIHYKPDHWWHSSALAKVSVSSILSGRGCCICWRGILAVITLKISSYKIENLFPAGSIIPVGHYITKLPGITGNFRGQLYSYKTSACISQGDHSFPGSHFRVLHEWPWLLMDTAESPGLTWYYPKSEMPQQSNHQRFLCQESRNSHFSFPQSTFSISRSWECPLHCHCQRQPGLLWLSTAEPRLAGCTGMSLKRFDCIQCLTQLIRMVKRL